MRIGVCQIGNTKVAGPCYHTSGDAQERPAVVKIRYKAHYKRQNKTFIVSGSKQKEEFFQEKYCALGDIAPVALGVPMACDRPESIGICYLRYLMALVIWYLKKH